MTKDWISRTIDRFCDKNSRKAKQLEKLLGDLEDFVSMEFNRSSLCIKEKLLESTPDDKLFFDMFLSNIRESLKK